MKDHDRLENTEYSVFVTNDDISSPRLRQTLFIGMIRTLANPVLVCLVAIDC